MRYKTRTTLFAGRGITYASRPWYSAYSKHILICLDVLLILCIIASICLVVRRADAYEFEDNAPLTMTAEQVDELYNYVRELELENTHLKSVVTLSEQTINKASEAAVKIDAQTQALIALYEHKAEVMGGLMERYETTLARLDTLTDKYEKRIVRLENENGFWKVVGVLGIAAGAASW